MPINYMKGQELPVSLIVLIVMALVILIFALIFIVLPIYKGAPGGQQTNNTQQEVAQFGLTCGNYCAGLPGGGNPSPPQTSFCTATISVPGATLHCYSSYSGNEVYSSGGGQCSYQDDNGTRWTASASTC